jgi:hypothetical protein
MNDERYEHDEQQELDFTIDCSNLYLQDTVTSRRIVFTFEGIEKLKAIRKYYEKLGLGKLPLPTLINGMINTEYADIKDSGFEIDDIPEYEEE